MIKEYLGYNIYNIWHLWYDISIKDCNGGDWYVSENVTHMY